MRVIRKTCYLFVFEGFPEYETSLAAVGITNSDEYQLKTIAITKDPVRTMGGLTVVPDLDFMPEIDLEDIDSDNTAMLILPSNANDDITPLISHCISFGIPVMAIGEATVNEFTHDIFNTLGIGTYQYAVL